MQVRAYERYIPLSPPLKYFTDRSKVVLFCGSFMSFFVFCFLSEFAMPIVRVVLYVPCGHLLGKG